MPDESLSTVRARLRRLSWYLRTVSIRQTARRAFDLTGLGTGPAERLCSALVLGSVFFFVALAACWLAGFSRPVVIGFSFMAFGSVMGASAVLVFWSSDEHLEQELIRVPGEIRFYQAMLPELEAAEREEAELPEAIEVRERPKTWCPYCAEEIHPDAVKCKHCGEFLDRRIARARGFNPGVAALLSFLVPGIGQIYKGQVLAGLVWMFLVFAGYFMCFIPGFFLHVFCMFDAAS